MKDVTFLDGARLVIALIVIVGGGFMVYQGRATAETIYTVIGVVLGFYFGSTSAAALGRAVTAALDTRK